MGLACNSALPTPRLSGQCQERQREHHEAQEVAHAADVPGQAFRAWFRFVCCALPVALSCNFLAYLLEPTAAQQPIIHSAQETLSLQSELPIF